jgi:Na+(H+)/acetate symporter ActP
MSAFLKIPMQFMILLIGVLVFVFYQFQMPPMIFNDVEAKKASASRSIEYGQIETEYKQVHANREKAALELISAQNETNEMALEAAKVSYRQTNAAFTASRKKATEFVKTTNENSSFNDVNYVFPMFVIQNMPMGVIGLIIAAIFAAAMSSISAELNALATASTIDFYKRHFNKEGTDKQYVLFGRFATFVWGMFACVVAIFSTNLGSLIEVVNTFGSYFYGSLLGVFVLAIVVKRARARGAFLGLLTGISTVAFVGGYPWIAKKWLEFFGTDDLWHFAERLNITYLFKIEFLWFNVIGCLATVLAGYLISLTVKEESK